VAVHGYPCVFMFMSMQVSVDLVLELASGGSLWSRIQRGGTSEQQAARCVCVCGGGGCVGLDGGWVGGWGGVEWVVGWGAWWLGSGLAWNQPLPYHHAPQPVDPRLRRVGLMDVWWRRATSVIGWVQEGRGGGGGHHADSREAGLGIALVTSFATVKESQCCVFTGGWVGGLAQVYGCSGWVGRVLVGESGMPVVP